MDSKLLLDGITVQLMGKSSYKKLMNLEKK